MCDKFPSIEQFRHFVAELDHYRASTGRTPTHYHLTGTVKLHGTHADIVATRANGDQWQYTYQSRNRVLTAQADNMGFAVFMDAIPAHECAELVDSIERTYIASTATTKPVNSIVIAGEWCGKGIQSGVALDKLPRMFVLYGVKVDGVWQPITVYRHVSLETARVYNILRVPAYQVAVQYDTIAEVLPQLQALTREVEAECPFAASLGVSGVGEGIVWVCDEWVNDSRGWFKTKGDKHMVSHLPTVATSSAQTKAALQNVTLFAVQAVTEARLRQGLDHLREMQLPVIRASTGDFIRWVWQDTQKEEADSIAELGLDRAALGKAVSKRALEWYHARLQKKTASAGEEASAADASDGSDG